MLSDHRTQHFMSLKGQSSCGNRLLKCPFIYFPLEKKMRQLIFTLYSSQFNNKGYVREYTQKTLNCKFSSVQLLSRVRLFATPWTAARQASLSITNSQSPPKPMSIESVMPFSHLILCRPLLLLSSMFPSIRVFSDESALRIRWPKYWSCNFKISPTNEHPGLMSLRMDWLDLLAVHGTEGGGFRMGNTCIPGAYSFWYLANLIQLC